MTADLHLDTGVLAVGAMPPDELAEAAAHVEGCDACTIELRGFLETVAMLGGAAAEVPPASLRESVMAAIARTPQLPPAPSHRAAEQGTPPSAPGPVPPPGPASTSGDSDAGPPSEGDLAPVVPLRRAWYKRPAGLLAAAAAAAIVATGTVFVINRTTSVDTQTALQECIEQASDAELLRPDAAAGDVTYSPSCAGVLVDVSGLPTLPDDRVYQLWMLPDETSPRSLSLLPDVADGGAQVVVASTQPGDAAVGITDEPAAGSAQPTSAPIWLVSLEA